MKRYGPIVAILVVIAIVAVILVVAGGGDDDNDDNKASNGSVQTSGGPVIINDSNRDSVDWGSELQRRAGPGEDPVRLRGAVRKAVHG